MKKNITKKYISVFLCACVICSLFSGCSGKIKTINFIYPFGADVSSYDPQIASTSDEFLIIENTFEGLIRIDDDGTVKKGVAESWSISDDKLTYTFKLKKGVKWNINTEKYESGENKGEYKDRRLEWLKREFNPDITANDFVFALRRAVSPETNAPLFPSVSGIKNAVAIHSGKMNPSTLGVSAPDNYTLVITLTAPDEAFMQTLSSSVAMPCNEEFFNATKGRYGLEPKYTLFNGQFYLKQILESSYLLKKNEYYCGEYPANAGELTLKINDNSGNKKSTVELLESGYYDAAFISGSESEKLSKAEGITYVPYEDTTWALLLNTSGEVFQSRKMRKAFCLGLSKLDKTEKKYIKGASNLLPSSCLIGVNNAVSATGATVPKQNEEKSLELWKEGLKILDTEEISVTILTTKEMENTLKQALQGIQSGIGNVVKDANGNPITFTIKVEALEQSELEQAVAKREYDAAFFPFKASTSSAITFLKGFSDKNRTGFDTKKLDKNLILAEKAVTLNDKAKYIKAAEMEIIDSYTVFPIVHETSYYASAKGIKGIQFHAGSGRVCFVNATREE